MYRLALVTRRGLRIGFNSYTYKQAKEQKKKFKNCIIIKEENL